MLEAVPITLKLTLYLKRFLTHFCRQFVDIYRPMTKIWQDVVISSYHAPAYALFWFWYKKADLGKYSKDSNSFGTDQQKRTILEIISRPKRYAFSSFIYYYSESFLNLTPTEQNNVSVLDRCPLYRGSLIFAYDQD